MKSEDIKNLIANASLFPEVLSTLEILTLPSP